MDDYSQTEAYKEYQQKMKEKEKTIIKADNSIHLDYLGETITNEDIEYLEKIAKDVDLQLSRFDKSGVIYASLDQYTLVSFLAVAQPLIENILIGAAGSAVWEAIKRILTDTWKNVRNKSYKKLSKGETQDKNLTFGLKVVLDKNTSFDFELSGNLDEKTIDRSLNRVLKFLNNEQRNKEYQHPKYVCYDSKLDEWIEIDVESERRKNIRK